MIRPAMWSPSTIELASCTTTGRSASCSLAGCEPVAGGGLPGHVVGGQSRRTHRHCAPPSPTLRHPSIPRREAEMVSPHVQTGPPDVSCLLTGLLTTPLHVG